MEIASAILKLVSSGHQKKHTGKCFLLHGKSIQNIKCDFQLVNEINVTDRRQTSQTLILLGSPFINTFIQETIHLNKKERDIVKCCVQKS